MPSVLFVCTANQFRSPIAEAYFQHKLESKKWKSDWIVKSAGTWTVSGNPALPIAVAIGHRLGLSLAGHRTTAINPVLVSTQDLILVMDKGHLEALKSEFSIFAERIHLLSEIATGKGDEIADPVSNSENSFQDIADQICALIDKGFYKICNRAMRTAADLHK